MFYTLKYLWVIDRARSHHLNLLGIFGWGLHLQLGLKKHPTSKPKKQACPYMPAFYKKIGASIILGSLTKKAETPSGMISPPLKWWANRVSAHRFNGGEMEGRDCPPKLSENLIL